MKFECFSKDERRNRGYPIEIFYLDRHALLIKY
jgi:hypothetical protein